MAARIAVKVHPRAKRTRLAGKLGEAYKLDIAAPPVDNKANEEVLRFFANLAGVPKSRAHILQGKTGAFKIIEIDGISQEELKEKLGA
jgi:uncharacterized protein YggU (UPF0235/DUF167 family)